MMVFPSVPPVLRRCGRLDKYVGYIIRSCEKFITGHEFGKFLRIPTQTVSFAVLLAKIVLVTCLRPAGKLCLYRAGVSTKHQWARNALDKLSALGARTGKIAEWEVSTAVSRWITCSAAVLRLRIYDRKALIGALLRTILNIKQAKT